MKEYEIIKFDIKLRKEDDLSPLIGFRFKPNKKNKLFSLLIQESGIIWSERYNCYILPDDVLFDCNYFNEIINLIDSVLYKIKSNKNIDYEIIQREGYNSYYTQQSLADFMIYYINSTINNNSILLDPAAGIGNLTDRINLSKDNIYLIEPNKQCIEILKKKGYKNIINSTFEEYLEKGNFLDFTHIIMNPPFKNRMDLLFFNNCFNLLQNNGRISAIISENSIYEELRPLGYTFNIDYPNNDKENNFEGLSNLLQEFIDNIHNTNNCFMDITTSFDNTSARAYYLLAEKQLKLKK